MIKYLKNTNTFLILSWILITFIVLFTFDYLFNKFWILAGTPFIIYIVITIILFIYFIGYIIKNRFKSFSIIYLLFFLLSGLAFLYANKPIIILGSKVLGSAHPNDEKLISYFYKHKDDFENLRDIFIADTAIGRVANSFTRAAKLTEPRAYENINRLSSERYTEYKKLFKKLKLKGGIEGYNNKDGIWFYSSSRGLSISGSSKGYYYSKLVPECLVDNLDNYWSPNGNSFKVFRRIDENWYIYFEFED